jgi:hypothetical protein
MGVEGNTDICRLLQTFETMSRGDPLSKSFWRLHNWGSFLNRRFISSSSLSRRSSGGTFLQVLVVTAKETKSKYFT